CRSADLGAALHGCYGLRRPDSEPEPGVQRARPALPARRAQLAHEAALPRADHPTGRPRGRHERDLAQAWVPRGVWRNGVLVLRALPHATGPDAAAARAA